MSRPLLAPRRLPAGTLLLVLAVSIVVATILLALVLLAANRRQLTQQDARRERVRRNLFSGLAYAQAMPELPPFKEHGIDLFDDGEDSVWVRRQPWGVFDVVRVRAGRGAVGDTALALLGSSFSPVNRAALYLSEENIPLTINDDAQVRGGAWLPSKGDVRPGSLPLLGPRRSGEAVTGKLRAGASTLPVGSPETLTRLQAYAQLQLEDLLPPGSRPANTPTPTTRSFQGLPAVWYREEAGSVSGDAAGQVVLISSHRLIVEPTSRLDNVLVLAPTIIVRSGFRGRAQFIARDTVAIGDNCQLAYPSAACAVGTGTAALVSVGTGTRLQGVVLASAATPGLACSVRLTTGTTLEGQVFSAGVVENCGLVRGTVMARRLLYHNVGSFFENYLVNATLDRTALSPHFLSTRLLNPGGQLAVAAWLR